ncbi:MAG: sigma 54-interacting transcriptional regulator [Fibrobacterales bacterium]
MDTMTVNPENEGLQQGTDLNFQLEMPGIPIYSENDAVLNHMHGVYVEVGLDLKFRAVNEYARKRLGYTHEEMIGQMSCLKVFPQYQVERLVQVTTKVMCNDYGNELEWEILGRNGSIMHIRATGYPLKDDAGNIIGIKVFGREVTGWKDLEAKLLASENRFRALFSQSPMGTVLFYANGLIAKSNAAFKSLYAEVERPSDAPPTVQSFISLSSVLITQLKKDEHTVALGSVVVKDGMDYHTQWRISRMDDSEVESATSMYIAYVEKRVLSKPIIRDIEQQSDTCIPSQGSQNKKLINKDMYLDNFIFNSPEMGKILAKIPSMAQSGAPLLIRGESGTGKEIIAHLIQESKNEKGSPFISLNCGSIPDSLIESELFGYRAGAFTDAKKNKKGKVELAQGGILFLDEIGDMPLNMQVKLLRLLEQKRFYPLGSETEVQVDIRIIAATHQPLEDLVAQKIFRQDLYYRLNVITVNLPPLRERKEDIPALCSVFLEKANIRSQKSISGFSGELLHFFKEYSFPGNIRELENIVDHMVIFCSEIVLKIDHLPDELLRKAKVWVAPVEDAGSEDNSEIEVTSISEAMHIAGGNKTKAAKLLGMHRSTLIRKLKKEG